MNLGNIRTGLKNRLATISGLRCYDVLPDGFAPPAALVAPPQSVRYPGSLGNAHSIVAMTVRVLVAKASDRSAQQKLDDYMGSGASTSVLDAIEADTSLGGSCNLARVLSAQAVGVYDYAGVPLLGCEFTIEVVA